MSLGSIVGSSEFAAALGGAGSAFLLEALRRWLADSTKKQASINLALLSLGEMYTVLKNFHDQVFIEPRAALAATLGRDPLPFEFKPAIGMSDHGLSGHHPYRSTRSATGGLHMTLTRRPRHDAYYNRAGDLRRDAAKKKAPTP